MPRKVEGRDDVAGIEWSTALDSYFGVKLTLSQSRFWDREIRDMIPGVQDDELVDSIRFASNKDRDKYSGKPTLKDLRIWVLWRRKEQREARGYAYRSDVDIVSVAKMAMLKAESFADRWNIMCDPNVYAGAKRTTTVAECNEIEVWASRRWRDWYKERSKVRMSFSNYEIGVRGNR